MVAVDVYTFSLFIFSKSFRFYDLRSKKLFNSGNVAWMGRFGVFERMHVEGEIRLYRFQFNLQLWSLFRNYQRLVRALIWRRYNLWFLVNTVRFLSLFQRVISVLPDFGGWSDKWVLGHERSESWESLVKVFKLITWRYTSGKRVFINIVSKGGQIVPSIIHPHSRQMLRPIPILRVVVKTAFRFPFFIF